MDKAESQSHVLIFPFPVQGHVNCMLKLAELLCLSSLNVTFISTTHNHDRLLRYTDIQSRFSRYPGFRFEVIDDGLPEKHPRSVFDLYDSLRATGKSLLRDLLSLRMDKRGPVSCIIADGLLGCALEAAEDVGISFFYFRTISPGTFWINFCLSDLSQAGELPFNGKELDVPIVHVKGMDGFLRRRDLPVPCRGDLEDRWIQMAMHETLKTGRANGLILNSFEDLDASILTHIRNAVPNVYTIGPLHAHLKTRLTEELVKESNSSSSLWKEDRSCMKWLDEQPSRSVIYVSFGSLITVTKEELLEVWHGLMNSGQRFLLVIRPDLIADRNGNGQIPDEILETEKGRGYLVDWAPQEDVLTHPATGGFLTHCGWNSTLESIVAGVPMICWPFHADQHVNSRFVEKVWKLGLDMKDTCDRNTIERMVRDLMVLRKDEFLKRASQMAKLARESTSKGGSSFCSLQRLVEDISSAENQAKNI